MNVSRSPSSLPILPPGCSCPGHIMARLAVTIFSNTSSPADYAARACAARGKVISRGWCPYRQIFFWKQPSNKSSILTVEGLSSNFIPSSVASMLKESLWPSQISSTVKTTSPHGHSHSHQPHLLHTYGTRTRSTINVSKKQKLSLH